jgi:uncharacterized protein (DUF2141 family)
VSPAGRVELDIKGLRSAKGDLRICLTAAATHFPNCHDDPAARRLIVPATAAAAGLRFEQLPSADYAIALIHDENSNRRLDTMAGVPREGFGFSRNPRVLFGPPRFSAARFAVAGGMTTERVTVKYLL